MPGEITKLNTFLMFKVPAAWFTGVRIQDIDKEQCKVRVKHRWINQNPFKSMYFAVQAMAAELSTGALVMQEVQQNKRKISMLVKSNKSIFSKKATGVITFECADGGMVRQGIQKALENEHGHTFWMESVGRNDEGLEVSRFYFEWTLRERT